MLKVLFIRRPPSFYSLCYIDVVLLVTQNQKQPKNDKGFRGTTYGRPLKTVFSDTPRASLFQNNEQTSSSSSFSQGGGVGWPERREEDHPDKLLLPETFDRIDAGGGGRERKK